MLPEGTTAGEREAIGSARHEIGKAIGALDEAGRALASASRRGRTDDLLRELANISRRLEGLVQRHGALNP